MNVGRLSDLGIEPFYILMDDTNVRNVNVHLGDNIVWITGQAPKGTDFSLVLTAIPKHNSLVLGATIIFGGTVRAAHKVLHERIEITDLLCTWNSMSKSLARSETKLGYKYYKGAVN
jgi:hypothetical protein